MKMYAETLTGTAIIAGVLPVLWSTGSDSELMQRVAFPRAAASDDPGEFCR